MLLTEEEAKKKRCTPSMPILLLDATQFNALATRGDNLGTCNCIGSACMQWNWYDYANEKGKTFRGPDTFAKGRAKKSSGDMSEFPARGYCGLATARE